MSKERRVVSEATYERMADITVQRRLYQDPRYKHAEDAEQQAEAEQVIEREVIAELDEKYEIEGQGLWRP